MSLAILTNVAGWNGYSVLPSGSFTLDLAEAVEELFQNCTISLMSSALLQYVSYFRLLSLLKLKATCYL